MQTLSEGFLDLAQALPLPASFPPYSTTIILVTIVTRLAFTVPFSVWAKKRQWRVETHVIPQLLQDKPGVQERVMLEMRKEKVRGTKDELRDTYQKRVRKALTRRRNELFSLHRCGPKATMLIPPITQLPIFVGTSMMLSHTAQPPTVFDSESFLTLTSLAHADPTATLPIALGLITLANVESSHWFVDAATRERRAEQEKANAEKKAQGQIVLEPQKIVQSALRVLAVGRILVGLVVPGGVMLYWVSSATFGLLQSWAFDWWERHRASAQRQRVSEAKPDDSPPPVNVRRKTR